MENYFTSKMILKSDEELFSIVADKEGYANDARLAAVWELEKRNKATEKTLSIKNEILNVQQTVSAEAEPLLRIEVPPKIKRAVYLIYGSLLVGFIKVILLDLLTPFEVFNNARSITEVLVTFLILGFIGYMIGRKRNWARITFLVMFAIGLVLTPVTITLPEDFRLSPFIGILSIIQLAMQLYALGLLFLTDESKWFKQITTAPNRRARASGG